MSIIDKAPLRMCKKTKYQFLITHHSQNKTTAVNNYV